MYKVNPKFENTMVSTGSGTIVLREAEQDVLQALFENEHTKHLVIKEKEVKGEK